MAQKVIKIGKSAGIVIPKAMREEYGIQPGDTVDLRTEDNGITIQPAAQATFTEEDKRVAKIADRFIRRYRSDIEALADK